eukprot:13805006-Alexandrium_andersonii.AAC.1
MRQSCVRPQISSARLASSAALSKAVCMAPGRRRAIAVADISALIKVCAVHAIRAYCRNPSTRSSSSPA